MKKVVTVIGARPQIIKAAAVSRAVAKKFSESLNEVIVHTGQHYDENMSQVFFDELGVPEPDYNLGVGSASHASQTAKMMEGIERILIEQNPDGILVYGDTNSTLAGALAASKLGIPVVHVEAGLRSFNKSMPEEINRIACDHCSTLLFTPTSMGLKNLQNEGFECPKEGPFSIDRPGVFHCGDIMYDNSLYFSKVAEDKSDILDRLGVEGESFALATVHRNNNTDDPLRLNAIFSAFEQISRSGEHRIVIPLHPRTQKLLATNLKTELLDSMNNNPNLIITGPASFLDMIKLERSAEIVMTDSGGVQKEAFFFEKPCLILRSETEWIELVENGNAVVTDANTDLIVKAFDQLRRSEGLTYPPFYGNGNAAEFVCQTMVEHL
jgi:UDP-GlcNAc3NAcA epimerase